MFVCGIDLQGICDSEHVRGDYFRAGPEIGALYQSCAQSDIHGCVSDLVFSLMVYLDFWRSIVVQMVSTFTSAFVQVGVKEWMFANVPDLCSPDQPQHLTCPHNTVYFTASAVWCVLFPFTFSLSSLTWLRLQGPHRT